jgi:hypothetical protein
MKSDAVRRPKAALAALHGGKLPTLNTKGSLDGHPGRLARHSLGTLTDGWEARKGAQDLETLRIALNKREVKGTGMGWPKAFRQGALRPPATL